MMTPLPPVQLCQGITALSEKLSLISNLNLPRCILRPSPLILLLLLGRRGRPSPHYKLISGSWREQSIELLRLEKTFKIIESKLNPTIPP